MNHNITKTWKTYVAVNTNFIDCVPLHNRIYLNLEIDSVENVQIILDSEQLAVAVPTIYFHRLLFTHWVRMVCP